MVPLPFRQQLYTPSLLAYPLGERLLYQGEIPGHLSYASVGIDNPVGCLDPELERKPSSGYSHVDIPSADSLGRAYRVSTKSGEPHINIIAEKNLYKSFQGHHELALATKALAS